MEIVPYSDREHYQEIYKWWTSYRDVVLDPALLPDGLVVSEDGVNICAGWIYLPVQCKLAQIGFVVSNPEVDTRTKYVGITLLVEKLEAIAKVAGYYQVNMISSSNGLSSLLKRNNYFRMGQHSYMGKKI